MKLHLLSLAVVSAVALSACNAPSDAPAPVGAAPVDAPAVDTPAPDAPAAAAPASNPMVGGAPMHADRDIVDNAANSKDHTTLVAAVKAAGLVDTLKGPGPFTVFAPTNAAFEKLPAGAVEGLLQPAKKDELTKVLTYHVVAGKLDAASLKAQLAAGGGSATLTTAAGGTLTAKDDGAGGITLTDAQGASAKVTIADVMQKNGVIHVVDTVLMP